MQALPFIDEHRLEVHADRERTWSALVQFAHGALMRPAPAAVVQLWRLDSATGFAIAEEIALQHLALRGQHRFSRYELAFDIDPGPDSVTLRARTAAEFPAFAGKLYRTLVIASGVHGVIVRRMLRRIAKRAERS
jgi:hypothetical protein